MVLEFCSLAFELFFSNVNHVRRWWSLCGNGGIDYGGGGGGSGGGTAWHARVTRRVVQNHMSKLDAASMRLSTAQMISANGKSWVGAHTKFNNELQF